MVDAIMDSGWYTGDMAIFVIFTFNFMGQMLCGAFSGSYPDFFLANVYMWIWFRIFSGLWSFLSHPASRCPEKACWQLHEL